MSTYIALVRKDHDSEFGVEFPDFPGCISSGATLDEAAAGAAEALALHVRGMLEDGEALPEPSALEAVLHTREAKGAVPILVRAPTVRDRAIRVNVTFLESVLERIDRAAAEAGKARSTFLADAAELAAARRDATELLVPGRFDEAQAALERVVGAFQAPRGGVAARPMTLKELAEARAQHDAYLRTVLPVASKEVFEAVERAIAAMSHKGKLKAKEPVLAGVAALLKEQLRGISNKEQAKFLKELSEQLAASG